MVIYILDTFLVTVLLLNFFSLASTRVRAVIYAVAAQGVLLGMVYPLMHWGSLDNEASKMGLTSIIRLVLFVFAVIAIKGRIIPQLLFQAMREVDIRWQVESLIGFAPSLLLGAVGTAVSILYAATLPLSGEHTNTLVVPAALATVLTGFLILITRQKALTQVLGYLVLENGIFIFGLLLIEAIPLLVEVGVLLDLFVGVFVMGIIMNHVSRELPVASTEHLSTLRE